MSSRFGGVRIGGGLWLIAVAVALAVRPPMPVDETRYLAVAWDMWLNGNYLVPHLNGAPYSHKPPLLFWLMTAGWHLFGVNDWSPRLVAPLFGLATMGLSWRLALALWPERRDVAEMTPLLLFGAVFWTLFTTLTMFDMMLAAFTVLALTGLVTAMRDGGWRGFALAGVAIGLGALAKGPAILLHILPVALAAPYWGKVLIPPVTIQWGRWYAGVFGAVVLGVVIGLAWAVPAGIAGGEAYREAIFWGQSAGRIVNSFAHARAWWWYLAVLPGLILPWLVWPPLWRAIRAGIIGRAGGDAGLRVSAIWFASAFVVFSAISGKQLHYLMPEFPALALVAARIVCQWRDERDRPVGCFADRAPAAALVAVLGVGVVVAPYVASSPKAVTWAEINTFWGLLAVAAVAVVLIRPPKTSLAAVAGIAGMSLSVIVATHLATAPILASRYDLGPLARQLKVWEDAGIRLANFGTYHGQYHFLGRLRKPIAEIGLVNGDEAAFLKAFPEGRIVAHHRRLPAVDARPVATYTFRRRTIAVWDAATLIKHPGIAERN